jgi:hypothetical protein
MATMKLKSLNIELQKWGANEGKYEGEIKYEGEAGEIKMILSPKISDALLVCIGETITHFAAEAANQVRDSIHLSLEEARKAPTIQLEKP